MWFAFHNKVLTLHNHWWKLYKLCQNSTNDNCTIIIICNLSRKRKERNQTKMEKNTPGNSGVRIITGLDSYMCNFNEHGKAGGKWDM